MLCRLCVFEIQNEFVFDFCDEKNPNDRKLAKLIAKHINLEFSFRNIDITTKICNNCFTQLEAFRSFCDYVDDRQKTFLEQLRHDGELKKEKYATHAPTFVPTAVLTEDLLDLKDVLSDNIINNSNTIQVNELPYIPNSEVVEKHNGDGDEDGNDYVDNNIDDKSNDNSFSEYTDNKKNEGAMQGKMHSNESSVSNMHKKKKGKIRKLMLRGESKRTQKTENDKQTTNSKQAKKYVKRCVNTTLEEKQKDEAFIAQHFSLKCELCEAPMETFVKLKKHFNHEHKTVGFVTCCDKRFQQRIDLVTHIKLHLDPNAFKCKLCGKILTSQKCLEIHNRNKHVEKEKLRFTCGVCGRKFAHANNMSSHALTHLDKKEFICEICDRAFKTKRSLFVHNRSMHTNIKPFICDTCGKEFKCKASFERHIEEHAGTYRAEPTEQCTICGKWLMKDGLRRHMDTHNTFEVECKECGKVLASKSALTAHIKYMHLDKPKLKCIFCNKTFKRHSNLKEHTAIHTGTKDYSCPHCAQEFRSKANMYVHIKRHHVNEWMQTQLARTKTSAPKEREKNKSGQKTIST